MELHQQWPTLSQSRILQLASRILAMHAQFEEDLRAVVRDNWMKVYS